MTGPTDRATSARFALGDAAKHLGADAAATFVGHEDEWWVIPILTGLGRHARASAPALVAKLEAQLAKPSQPALHELVLALGAVGGPVAWEALERLAATNEGVAIHLPGFGKEATPALVRLLAAPLAQDVHQALLDGFDSRSAPDPSLAPAVLRFLDSPNPRIRLVAISAAAAFELDHATTVQLASVFIACSAEIRPFWRTLHDAAHRMAPVWASRIDHESDIVAMRCIEALGWTREYGEDYVPALRALATRLSTASLRGRFALEAAERISDPEPIFRPDS